MIKFTGKLVGYGFDIAADRVVRFNKHPEGTYLNTRATYEINAVTYSHHYLRGVAVESQFVESKEPPKKKHKLKWIIAGIILLVVVALTDCSFHFNVDTYQTDGTEEVQQEAV